MQRPRLGLVAGLHSEVGRVQRIRHNQREQQAPDHRDSLLDLAGGSVGDHRVRHGLAGVHLVPRSRGQRENGRDREREDLKKKKKKEMKRRKIQTQTQRKRGLEKVFSFFVFVFEFFSLIFLKFFY